jgi:hypothetical protein
MGTDSVSYLWIPVFIAFAALPWLLRRAKVQWARSWPQVLGHVESAWVCMQQQKGTSFFSARLAYSYSVNGERHTGVTQRNFGNEQKATAWVARFPDGLPLQVRYRLSNVADSVVDERDQL